MDRSRTSSPASTARRSRLSTLRRGFLKSRGARPSQAAWFVHFFGMLALIAGVLTPLTDPAAALAAPQDNNPIKTFAQDQPVGAAQAVGLNGDLQASFENNDGIWTAQAPASPGSYNYQIVVQDGTGNQVSVDEGSVEVGDNQTGAFFSYNAHTNETSASGQDALFVIETDQGSVIGEQDGGDVTAIVTSSGGSLNAQLTANGEAVGDPQSLDLQSGSNRITFSVDGSSASADFLGYATLTIQRLDADGNPLTGACFEVRDGNDLVNQGCDGDDGDDGQIFMTFPGGFQSGNYTLVETRAPDGAEPVEDQEISLNDGDNSIQVQSVGGGDDSQADDGQADDGGQQDDGNAEDATTDDGAQQDDGQADDGGSGDDIIVTDDGGDDGSEEPTEEPTEDVVEPGDLIVTLTDQDGNPVPGACFELIDGDGNSVGESCDSEDQIPNNGTVGFFGIPAGTYTLRQTQTPEGSEPVDDQDVEVPAGAENNITVQTELLQPTEVPTGSLTVSLQDQNGDSVSGACFDVRDGDGNTVASACDGDDGDDDGTTNFGDLPAGNYSVTQTNVPEGTEQAEDQDVEVQEGEDNDVSFETTLLEPTEVPTGSLSVTLTDQDGNSIPGACFDVQDGDGNTVASACDGDDGDDDGTTSFGDLPEGSYTVVQSNVPEGSEPIDNQEVDVTAGEDNEASFDTSLIEPTEEPTEEPTPTEEPATGTLSVTLQDENGEPVTGACFELRDGDGNTVAGACDGDDENGEDGTVVFQDVIAGSYTLVQTSVPDGSNPVEDQDVEVPADDQDETTVETSLIEQPTEEPTEEATEEPTEVPTEEATEEPTAEPTEEATEEATEEPTEEPTEAPEGEYGDPGDLIVTLNDENGEPLGGACFDLVNSNDETITSCDADDPFPGNGRTGFFGVPSGEYTLRQSTTPEGYEPIKETQITIEAGAEANEVFQAVPSGGEEETPTPEETPEGEETPTPEGEETPETGQTGVRFDFTAFDLEGQQVCVELNTGGEIGLSDPPAACDNGDGDADPAEGVILLADVPPGDYAVFITSGPESLTSLEIPAVTINDGEVAEAQITAPVPTEVPTEEPSPTSEPTATPEPTPTPEPTATSEPSPTPEPEPGAISVQVNDQDGNQVEQEGTCLAIDGVTEQVCDNQDGDANGDTGQIQVDDVPEGSYDIAVTEQPEGLEAPAESAQAEVVAGETAEAEVVLGEAAPTTGVITINVIDGDGNPIPGGCFDVTNSSGTFNFCDEDNDGVITIPDVVFGQQTVTQTSASDGYTADPSAQTPTVDEANPAATLTFTNPVVAETANLPVTAVDGEGNALPGACYTVSDEGGTPLADGCDDGSNGDTANDGTVIFAGLPVGNLTVTETTAPAGYALADPQSVTTVSGDNEALAITHTAAPITITVITQDGDGNALPNACTALDGGSPVCDQDGDGVVQLENVAPGDHTLTQTTAPEGFESAADTAITVEIGGETQFIITNDNPLNGSVEIVVTDSASNPVGGTCATVGSEYSACDNDGTDTNPASGTIGITDVVPGDYDVTLSNVSDAYEEPGTVPVTVNAGEVSVASFTLEDAPPQVGSIKVSFVAEESDEAVAGVCVQLLKNNQVVLDPVCDNEDGDQDPAEGVIVLNDVPVGSYLLAYDLPDGTTGFQSGFQTSGTRSVTVSAAQQAEVVIAVIVPGQPATGTVEIVTRDNATNQRLAGSCYSLDDIEVCDNDADDQNPTNGIIQLDDVLIGDYTLSLITVPDGYTGTDDQDIEVVGGTLNHFDVRLDALPENGSLIINKVDPDGEPLGNSCFALQRPNTNVVISSVCDASDSDPNDGQMVIEDLPAGQYRLVETKAPSNGYNIASPRTVTIKAGEETEVTVTNQPKPGRIVVTKVDANNANQRLAGACFRLEGDIAYGPFCDDSDGQLDGRITFNNIVPGEYDLVETQAPEGYDPADPQSVTVTPGSSQSLVVANSPTPPPAEKGNLTVHKLNEQGEPISGACFRLFNDQTPVTAQVCDNADGANDGLIRFIDAPAGNWTLRETVAPSSSYQIAEDQSVTVQQDTSVDVNVTNVLKPGRVYVTVKNQDGQLLQDVCFDLATDNKGLQCTNASGVAIYSGLEAKSYRLSNTKVPYGYDKPANVNNIKVQPGKTTFVNLTIKRTPPPSNSGSIQVLNFYCQAGEGAERTQFLGASQGAAQLKKTTGCNQGNASFTIALENSDQSAVKFSTGADGQYQAVLGQGIYVLTETDPSLGDQHSARVRIYTGQQTTVIVINYVKPPEPEPAVVNATKYTCAPSFNGSVYEDFLQNCTQQNQLTNGITIRVQGPVNAKGVTGDGGEAGKTSIEISTPGTYSIFEDRPYNIPTDYLFCGWDASYPADWKAVNGKLDVKLDYGQTLTCAVFDIPELLTKDTGAILVHKYTCNVKNPPKGYNWEEECSLSTQQAEFDLKKYDGKTQDYGPATRTKANPDGLARYTGLGAGTYQLREVGMNWCHAESNSVNAQGDVVVKANKLSEVWIYNCVDNTEPPNTGSGTSLLNPSGDGPSGLGVALSLAWPLLAAGAWFAFRRRMQHMPKPVEVRRAA